MAKLVVISKGQAGLSQELGQHWVTIGRAPGNGVQISESPVSGQHCEVLLRGNELVVRDMRSTNGTFINGSMVTEGVLRMGEVLRLGEIDLRLEASVPKVIMFPSPSSSSEDSVTNRNAGLRPGNYAAEDSIANRSAGLRPGNYAPAPSPIGTNGNGGGKKHQVLLVDDS